MFPNHVRASSKYIQEFGKKTSAPPLLPQQPDTFYFTLIILKTRFDDVLSKGTVKSFIKAGTEVLSKTA
jgi:hypothetical protein